MKPARSHEKLRGATPLTSNLPPQAINSILLALTGGIRDQGQTPWCTGHSMAESLSYAYVGQTGLAITLSAMFAYVGGKLLENQFAGLPSTAPINDDGADFANLILAAQAQGVCTYDLMPTDSTLLQQKENYVQIADANQRKVRVGEFAGIAGTDDQSYINALCQCLLPLGDGKLGSTVDIGIASSYPAFDDADGTTILVAPPTNGISIDHEVELVDYYTVIAVSGATVTLSNGGTFQDPTGTVKVGDRCPRLQNHWSPGWAPNSDIPGTVIVHQSFMTGQRALGGDAMALNPEVTT
jgi:hypothetical protein